MAVRKAPAKKKSPLFAWLVIIENVGNSRAYFELAGSEQEAYNKAKRILEDEEMLADMGMSDIDDIEVTIVNVAERSVYSAVRSGVVLEKIR